MKDIYFEKDYGRLYEKIENGICEVFEFESSLGSIRHLFIKREISLPVNGGPFYDLTTPYGYGGPVITTVLEGKRAELVLEFKEAFQQYCYDNHIVSEFIRFHPIIGNASDFRDCYDVSYKRNTVQTQLAIFEDPVLSEYSSSCRRDIRRAFKSGVEYRVSRNPENLQKFKEIYYLTMERNHAERVYYFDDYYFSKCIELFAENLVFVEVKYQGEIIGMSLNFASEKIIHAHLTGTLQEFHHLFPAYVLQYALAVWGKENGFSLIHHGGGRTGESDDKLYLFKRKFGKTEDLYYYTGRKIWNAEVYQSLCKITGAVQDPAVFPAYRQQKVSEKVI